MGSSIPGFDFTVQALSPTLGTKIPMNCHFGGGADIHCVGGNNAAVDISMNTGF